MRTFGSSLNFDQIIWALCNTTEGSDPKIIRSALTNATFGIFLCMANPPLDEYHKVENWPNLKLI